jgi:hypothetical protein
MGRPWPEIVSLSSTVMFTGVNPFRYNFDVIHTGIFVFQWIDELKIYFGYRLEILPKAAASPL